MLTFAACSMGSNLCTTLDSIKCKLSAQCYPPPPPANAILNGGGGGERCGAGSLRELRSNTVPYFFLSNESPQTCISTLAYAGLRKGAERLLMEGIGSRCIIAIGSTHFYTLPNPSFPYSVLPFPANPLPHHLPASVASDPTIVHKCPCGP